MRIHRDLYHLSEASAGRAHLTMDARQQARLGFDTALAPMVPASGEVDQDGKVDLQWLSWIGEPEATRSRMVVDNLLGRGADHIDTSESSLDNPDFRRALLHGWQRMEAVIERNFRLEHFCGYPFALGTSRCGECPCPLLTLIH